MLLIQVGEYLLDKLWIFDAGNDLDSTPAGLAGLDVYIEYSFQALGPEPAPDTRLREHMLDPGSWRHMPRLPMKTIWNCGAR